MTAIPPQLQGQLGTGQIELGKDAQGYPIVVPDDHGLGKHLSDGLYAANDGNLNHITNAGGAALGAFNVLNDPQASIDARLAAQAALAVAVTSGAAALAVYGGAEAAAAAAAITASIPMLNLLMAAYVAVSIAIYEIAVAIWGKAGGGPVHIDTPAETLEAFVAATPPDMPVPQGAADPSLLAINVMTILAARFDREAHGLDTGDLQSALASTLGGQAGLAEDMYQTVAQIVKSDRWQCGYPSPWLLSEVQAVNARGWPIGSTYAATAAAFGNHTIPHYLPYEMQIGADGKVYPVPGGGAPGSLDVSRYLIIFSVLYHLKSPRQARAATYAAVFMTLLQKAWVYQASNPAATMGGSAPVPDALYGSLGFLLDEITRFPLARLEPNLQAFSATGAAANVTVFHGLEWYVQFYLARDPRFAQGATPPQAPTGPLGGGAQQAPPPAQVAVPFSPGALSGERVFQR